MAQKRSVRCGLFGLSLSCLWVAAAQAATAVAPALTVGSANVAVADPTVPRPPGHACVVELFHDVTFTDFNTRPYSYAPPLGCGNGHWKKVVLEADFSVSAGRQFDRTATLWLGGVNLYFGTTQEPSATVSPSWHVERDLTDYSALLRSAGQGQAIIGNIVNDTYTGVIHGSARLVFYPGATLADAVPDAVYPLGSDPVGNTTVLNSSTDQLSKTLTLPRNVTRAYLDVFAQSQGGDEFWYTCVPDQYAAQTQECGGGNFRETEVSIDGQPAGVAPVLPWIYTGGIDPYLWRPTPGAQTLNFMPYRVDLTPFAGLLSDGRAHQVAVSVAGAHGYFSATAALLVYQDPHARQVSGQLVRNTLVSQPPVPVIGSTLATAANGDVSGAVITRVQRQFAIEGYVDTSHGRVRTTVNQTVGFDDTQTFTIDADTFRQQSDQTTRVDSVSRSALGSQLVGEYREHVRYPLHLDYNQQVASDGSISVASTIEQGIHKRTEHKLLGTTLYASHMDDHVAAADTLQFDANFAITGHTGQRSAQEYRFGDSLGSCYQASVTTAGVLTAHEEGRGCRGGRNTAVWFSHPDGSPDSRSWSPFW